MPNEAIKSGPTRVEWVDYAKGICIILVVMMHSTLGVEAALGEKSWMNSVIEWARPFRMPDFFLISGLFLAARIDRPWRSYLDTKVVHFAYFYILWMTIQFALKGPAMVAEMGIGGAILLYLQSFVEPFGTLWFIHMLAIFFVVTKLVERVPVAAVWLAGAALETANIHTGSTLIDEFAARFVYFYSGYVFAKYVFQAADWFAGKDILLVIGGLGLWGLANGWLVFSGYATFPFVSLALGFVGTGAVVGVAVMLARSNLANWLRYCGEHSIVIYLAFFLFMAASRKVLLMLGIIPDAGSVSLIVTAAGVIGPVLMFWIVRVTPLKFLFERPALFTLSEKAPPAPAKIYPAE